MNVYMKANTFQLARDILQGKWLVSEPDKLIPIARAFLGRLPLDLDAAETGVSLVAECGVNQDGKGKAAAGAEQPRRIAVVPLKGTMTKYDTCLCDGTATIATKIFEFADDDTVVGIVLDIDSGGGSSSSVAPLVQAISHVRSKGKPVYAHVDFCGSAAYWIATQCDAIYMDNELSEVGSIGAMAVFTDSSAPNPSTGERTIVVYADESKDKNLAYRDALAGNYEAVKAELKPLVEEFRKDVVAGRPSIAADAEGVMTGRMFRTPDAISLGMADAKRTLPETVDVVFAITSV